MTLAPTTRSRVVARALAIGLAAAVTVSACASDADVDDGAPTPTADSAVEDAPAPLEIAGDGRTDPADTSVDFTACGPRVECAQVDVPIDHAEPDGATTSVAVTRHLSSADRIGTLFVNPGGPGVAAGDLLHELVDGAPPVIVERFDLVAVDPRGTGGSDALDCTPDDGDPTVTFPVDLDAYLAYFTELSEACAADPGVDVLASLTTENAARDLDAVRAALGDEQVSFLGYSWGTALGQVYASLFPDRVRAMVLDAPVVLAPDESPLALIASGAETAIERANASCAVFPDCLPDGPSLLVAIDDVRRSILAGELGSDVDVNDLDRSVRSLVGNPARLVDLSEALGSALDGDGAPLARVAATGPSLTAATTAVACADGWNVASATVAELPAQADETTGGVLLPRWEIPCDLWPVVGDGLGPVADDVEAPVLVVANLHDPISPIEWAETVAVDIGPTATLLVAERSQHGVTFGSSMCVDDHVATFLVDLVQPNGDCTLPGIFYMGVTPDGLIEGFLPGGPADLAGFEPGDRVLAVDGVAYDPVAGFPGGTAGQEVTVTVARAGEELVLNATRWPAEPWETWRVAE